MSNMKFKNLFCVPFCITLLISGALLVPMAAVQAQQVIDEVVVKRDFDKRLRGIYQHIHANPELSFQEKHTSEYLAKGLERIGFKVTRSVGDHPKMPGEEVFGVVGLFKNGSGPTVMLRADTDALPIREQTGANFASKALGLSNSGLETPVMHACGHDVHMTVLMGAAKHLVDTRSEWSGTLMVIFQPAEEVGGGALAMLNDGLFERFPRPDYNLALHVSPATATGTVAMASGFALANVDSVDIVVKGVGGHGAYPHGTKDPVVLAARIVTALQTIVSREVDPLAPAVVTVGSIHGGTKHNIIPDEVTLQLTVRTYDDEVRRKVLNSIERVARGTAIAAGLPENLLPIVTSNDTYTPATYNEPEFTARVAKAIGRQIGAENVDANAPKVMGGEDFGRYGREGIPSLLFWLGSMPQDFLDEVAAGRKPPAVLHSPTYLPDLAPTVVTGVQAMYSAAREAFASQD